MLAGEGQPLHTTTRLEDRFALASVLQALLVKVQEAVSNWSEGGVLVHRLGERGSHPVARLAPAGDTAVPCSPTAIFHGGGEGVRVGWGPAWRAPGREVLT
jgi:hypothetical protein